MPRPLIASEVAGIWVLRRLPSHFLSDLVPIHHLLEALVSEVSDHCILDFSLKKIKFKNAGT